MKKISWGIGSIIVCLVLCWALNPYKEVWVKFQNLEPQVIEVPKKLNTKIGDKVPVKYYRNGKIIVLYIDGINTPSDQYYSDKMGIFQIQMATIVK